MAGSDRRSARRSAVVDGRRDPCRLEARRMLCAWRLRRRPSSPHRRTCLAPRDVSSRRSAAGAKAANAAGASNDPRAHPRRGVLGSRVGLGFDRGRACEPHTPPPRSFADPWVYRSAVGGISVAVVAFLIGAAVLGSAERAASEVFHEYLPIGTAVSGALIGIIAPSFAQQRAHRQHLEKSSPEASSGWDKCVKRFRSVEPALLALALVGVFVISFWGAEHRVKTSEDAALLRTLAAGAAGALRGLLAPSPAVKH
jgi:hypothetical protein